MAKINILSDVVCNRIAAGEVIDRPYSAVKEMIENSIDAGATEIEVYIERGGKDLIRITDNGCGIEKDDMRAAFFSHATSKISTLEDIDNIKTLGFRGEALATIAAIAQVELISVTEGNDAWKVECDGEYIGKVQPAALDRGTQITVRNIFFNTPVRRKFLKTDKKEETDITSFVSRYILCNPRIAFKYFVDGKLTLQSYGGGLEEAIAQVYGANYLPQSFKINADRNDIKIYGFIGNQNFFKPNKSYQNVFLNGRCISNNVISTAIAQAYAPYAMKRNYPVYTLFIDVPHEMVDVNVHPNKADVRFENNQIIYGCIYSIVSAVLDGSAAALDFVVGAKGMPAGVAAPLQGEEVPAAPLSSAAAGQEALSPRAAGDGAKNDEDAPQNPVENEKSGDLHSTTRDIDRKNYDELFNFAKPSQMRGGAPLVFHDSGSVAVRAAADVPLPLPAEDVFAENKRFLEERERKARQQKWILDNAVFRGALFNTYLLYEEGDDVYIIDQHAAHERLLFDRLKAEMDARQVMRQPMLVPYILTANAEEHAFLSEHLSEVEAIGFDIEEFGACSFKISTVPLDLRDIDLGTFFADLFAEVGSLRGIRLSDLLRDKIAMTACKHAVKGGMLLTDSEKEKLFAMLHGDMGLKCPHGRPVCVRLTKTEVEKMFKRIV